MDIFDRADENINDIFKFLLMNDNVKRLLGNNAKTALADQVPDKDWINDYLFDTPRVPDITSEVKSFIMIEVDSVSPTDQNNTYINDVVFTIDLMCHESVTRLSNGRRQYKLASLVKTGMREIKTSSIKGEFTFISGRKFAYSNEFQGYRLTYRVTNATYDCGA